MTIIGFLIFFIYIAIAAVVAYGAIVIINDIRKLDNKFLIGWCRSDYQCLVSLIMAIGWPIAALIGFAILFAFKKIKS